MISEASMAEPPRVRWGIAALSAVVFALVPIAMSLGPESVGAAQPDLREPSVLARINVCLNAAAGGCLLLGLFFVRAGRIAAHRLAMSSAFGLSSAFLVTYLMHHAQVGSVPFRGEGIWRLIYFSVLVPHVILAAVIVPLALLTLYRGWTGKIASHRRIARYTFPLWLFVSLSGVAVYLMLYHLP